MTARSDDGHSGQRVILRRDHIAGGVFVIGGVLLFAMSGDLPFGTLASPGAGMMPKLVLGLLIIFGAILVVRAGESPPLAEIEWNNFTHAVTVVVMAAANTCNAASDSHTQFFGAAAPTDLGNTGTRYFGTDHSGMIRQGVAAIAVITDGTPLQ